MQAVPLSPGFRPLAVNIAVPGALEIVTVPADHEFAPLVVVSEKAEYEACHTNRPLPSRPIGIAASSNANRMRLDGVLMARPPPSLFRVQSVHTSAAGRSG